MRERKTVRLGSSLTVQDILDAFDKIKDEYDIEAKDIDFDQSYEEDSYTSGTKLFEVFQLVFWVYENEETKPVPQRYNPQEVMSSAKREWKAKHLVDRLSKNQ